MALTTSTRLVFSRRTVWGLVVFTCVSVGYGTIQIVPHPADARELGSWIATLGFIIAFPLSMQYRRTEYLLLSGLSAVAQEALAPSGPAIAAAIASVAVAAGRLDQRAGVAVSAITAVGFVAADLGTHAHIAAGTGLSVATSLFFTYVAMSGVRRLREEQQRTETLLQEVLANRDAQIRAAALDERAHLAREIHDVLAHTLSALTIQLEGTRMLVEQRTSDSVAVDAIDRAWRLAREGLEETRRAVGALRGDALPGPELLPDLADDFERDTAIPCTFAVEGETRSLGSDARLALYRTAQEALTNVRKHTDASSVSILLHYDANWTCLTVENRGVSRPSTVPGGGYGLNGMRERAELLGGRLEAGATETGFRVSLRIPA